MFTSPLASLTGWSWTRTKATDLPKVLRRSFPPSAAGTPGPAASPASQQWAVQGTGPGTALRFATSGRWHHAQAETSVHWIWGKAADLARFPSLRTQLPLGNPVIGIRFDDAFDALDEKGDPNGVVRATGVDVGNGPVSVAAITVVAFAPGAPALDSIGVLRYLRDALEAAALSSGTPTWQDFVGAFNSVEQPLRILEPGGSPATGQVITISGGSGPVTLGADSLGDALAALGITRAALSSGQTLDVAGGAEVVATSAGMAFPSGVVPLSPNTSHVTVASLASWFAPQGAASLQRFTRGNTVVPFADGAATLADLFRELHGAVTAGNQGAFYVTGYSLQHDATLGPSGPPGTMRTVEDVATAMGLSGGDPRFLALQMLQLNPSWVRTVESSAALIGFLLAIGGYVGTIFQDDQSPDQLSFILHSQALAMALIAGSASLDSILEGKELNRGSIDALKAIPGVAAYLDPVDADVDDNPHTSTSELIDLALPAQRNFNVFHQKIQLVRNGTGLHAYCGGIDLNANRTQDRDHASRGPFHDVHARVNGRAAGELATTFIERWGTRTPALRLAEPRALDDLPSEGPDVVQVARTYYGAVPGSGRGFSFAPNGERTIIDTLLQAIGRARRHIYIEDQYLTPPAEFASALAAAAARVSGPLVILVPSTTDQPFGLARRQAFIQQMSEAWGDRFKVGILRKRFSCTQTSFKAAKGRLWLVADLGEAAADNVIEIGPVGRLPDAPFWLVVDGEAMRAYQKVPGFSSPAGARFYVDRAEATNLFKKDSGTKRADHKPGAAVVTGLFPAIYVHTKMVLIDDAFASIGSANCNRRGYYSDGECNIFAVRDTIADGDNWIRNLRVALWAEHLGVTEEYGKIALLDPAACLPLFDRKFTTGNRFTSVDAQPYSVDLQLAAEFTDTTTALGGLAMIGTFAAGIGAAIAGSQSDAIFDTIVDPGSQVE